jgi:RNA polymerase sigma factor (sigma-70 family)
MATTRTTNRKDTQELDQALVAGCSVATASRSTCWCASTSIGAGVDRALHPRLERSPGRRTGHVHPRVSRDRELPRRCAVLHWLHRIAVNTAKNHLVAHNRRPPTDDIDVTDAEQFDSGIRLRDTDTPERELMRQEIETTVMRAVERLPTELREAITLREVDGLSYEDIAERMQCPIGTVRSRIFRAREAIDDELRPCSTPNRNASVPPDEHDDHTTIIRLDREALSALFDGELVGDVAAFRAQAPGPRPELARHVRSLATHRRCAARRRAPLPCPSRNACAMRCAMRCGRCGPAVAPPWRSHPLGQRRHGGFGRGSSPSSSRACRSVPRRARCRARASGRAGTQHAPAQPSAARSAFAAASAAVAIAAAARPLSERVAQRSRNVERGRAATDRVVSTAVSDRALSSKAASQITGEAPQAAVAVNTNLLADVPDVPASAACSTARCRPVHCNPMQRVRGRVPCCRSSMAAAPCRPITRRARRSIPSRRARAGTGDDDDAAPATTPEP